MNTYKRHRFRLGAPHQISFPTQSGFTIGSILVTEILKISLLNEASSSLANGFVTAHAAVSNLFNLGRHLVRAQPYRDLRASAFTEWERAVA